MSDGIGAIINNAIYYREDQRLMFYIEEIAIIGNLKSDYKADTCRYDGAISDACLHASLDLVSGSSVLADGPGVG